MPYLNEIAGKRVRDIFFRRHFFLNHILDRIIDFRNLRNRRWTWSWTWGRRRRRCGATAGGIADYATVDGGCRIKPDRHVGGRDRSQPGCTANDTVDNDLGTARGGACNGQAAHIEPPAIREIGSVRHILNQQIVGYRYLDVVRPDQAIGQVDPVVACQPAVDIWGGETSDIGQRLAGHRVDIGGIDREVPAAGEVAVCVGHPDDTAGGIDKQILAGCETKTGICIGIAEIDKTGHGNRLFRHEIEIIAESDIGGLRAADIVRDKQVEILHHHVEPAHPRGSGGEGHIAAGMDTAEFLLTQIEAAGRVAGSAQHHLRCAIGENPDVTGQIGLAKTPGRTYIHVRTGCRDGVAHDIGLNVNQTAGGDPQIIRRVQQTVEQNVVPGGNRNVAPCRKYVLRTVEVHRCRLRGREGIGDGGRAPRVYDDVPCGFRSLYVEIAGR